MKVVRDAAGDIIVTGTTDDNTSGKDILTIKYSGADGSVIWQQRYNGQESGDDVPKGVAVDSSGNAVLTGTSSDSSGNRHYYTAKYAAADGALLWEKRYNGPGSDAETRAVAVDNSGNVVITGFSDREYYTAKYAAANGALVWETRYNGPANGDDLPQGVALDATGNVIVTGYSYGGASDYYTAKYAGANGAVLWEKPYNNPANRVDYAYAGAVDDRGNVVVTGRSYNQSSYDYYTAKYAAADGALLWEKRFIDNGYATFVAVDDNSNVVVTGTSGSNLYAAEYAAADGALLWEKTYTEPG